MLDENSYSFENQQVTPTFVEHKQIEKNRRFKGNSTSNSVSYINFPLILFWFSENRYHKL